MKNFFLPAALAFLSLTTPALALDLPFYGKVSAGVTDVSTDYIDLSDGRTYGVAVGTAIGPVRVEAAAERFNADFAGAIDVSANIYSVTAFADLPITPNTGVFAGIGVDRADANLNLGFYDYDTTGDGWHYTIGAAHRISERAILEVSARQRELSFDYFDTEDTTFSAGIRFRL